MADQKDDLKSAQAAGVDERLLNPARSNSGGGGQSTAQLRGSRASIAAPTKERIFNPHAQNPGRIPTAGGVSVGSKQYEQRRASRISTDMAAQASRNAASSPPPVEEEGSSAQAESSKDAGAVNGAPSSDAPAFNIPDYDGSKQEAGVPVAPTSTGADESAGSKEAGVPVSANDAGTEAPGEATATDLSAEKTDTTDKSTMDKVKEKVPNISAAGSSSSPTSPNASSPSKERRGSRFEAFKGKLGLGKK